MLVSTNVSLPGAADLEIDPAFSVVVAYEDLEAGKHAQKTCEFLMERLGDDCRFINKMWKFDALTVPGLREMAANDAALADLIFISSHGTSDLPVDVKAWIELWHGRQSAAFALVALFDRPEESVAWVRPIQDYLARVARRGQMEFFAQPDVWPDNPAAATWRGGAELPDEAFLRIAAVPTKDNNVRYWGLNE